MTENRYNTKYNTNNMTQEAEKNLFKDSVRFINGYRFMTEEVVTSTNDVLKQLARRQLQETGQCQKTALLANSQTAGRGRLGRSYYSPADSGLYLSCILPVKPDGEYPVTLTAAAAVAICRAVDGIFGISLRIKWVNDLYLNDKKVCGILAEAVSDISTAEVSAVVLGIGINCGTEEFPKDFTDSLANAGSLGLGTDFPKIKLAERILTELDRIFEASNDMPNDMPNDADFMDEYRQRSYVLHEKIYVIKDKIKTAAYVKDIDKNGGLVVQYEGNGQTETLTSGEISVRLV